MPYKYIANITFKQFTRWCFTISLKKWTKDDTFLRKKTEEKQYSATMMISVVEKGTSDCN